MQKLSLAGILLIMSLSAGSLPDGFVYIKDVIPNIVLDIRYYSDHNFVGTKIDGYEAAVGIITEKAALALADVQAELNLFNMSLKIYDAYRPQQAVDHFIRWAADFGDTLTKREFYPTLDKPVLLEEVYIATRSSHTRGSAVDLTIVPLPVPEQEEYDIGVKQCECYRSYEQRFKDNSIDMGAGYDCFHPAAHTANPELSVQQRSNRALLKSIMEKQGFRNYSKEWWHFNLIVEPYPETYFNFPIK